MFIAIYKASASSFCMYVQNKIKKNHNLSLRNIVLFKKKDNPPNGGIVSSMTQLRLTCDPALSLESPAEGHGLYAVTHPFLKSPEVLKSSVLDHTVGSSLADLNFKRGNGHLCGSRDTHEFVVPITNQRKRIQKVSSLKRHSPCSLVLSLWIILRCVGSSSQTCRSRRPQCGG